MTPCEVVLVVQVVDFIKDNYSTLKLRIFPGKLYPGKGEPEGIIAVNSGIFFQICGCSHRFLPE